MENFEDFICKNYDYRYQAVRLHSKEVRKKTTNCLNDFASYAVKQGSKGYKKNHVVYSIFSRLINNTLHIKPKQRDNLPIKYLIAIELLEYKIVKVINTRMTENVYYKDIYKECSKTCKIMANSLILNNCMELSFKNL